jgi:hypothetical protein
MLEMQQYGIKTDQTAAFDARDVGSASCQEDTRKSIRQEIIDWAIGADPDKKQTIFWLNGGAGLGKSAIAQSTAHEFAQSQQLGASYFFKRPERSKSNLFFSTLASALVRSIPPLTKYVYQSMDELSTPLDKVALEEKSLATQFDTLIFKPLRWLSNESSITWARVLVIDALDECEDAGDVRFICQQLVKLHNLPRVRLRMLLTSRDERPIGPELRKAENAGVVHARSFLDFQKPKFLEESKNDLRAYLMRCLQDIKNDREMTGEWPSPPDIDRLFTLGTTPSPLFIYVATFYRSLIEDGSESLQTQLNRWLGNKHTDSELAKVYGPMMERLLFVKPFQPISPESKRNLHTIVSAIILLNSPLSRESLASLLDLSLDIVETWVKALRAVLVDESEHNKTVRIVHASFHDFLLGKAKSMGLDFWVDEQDAHRTLAKSCLSLMRSTLRRNLLQLTDQRVSVTAVNPDQICKNLPQAVRYACTHWVEHLEKGSGLLDEDDHQFLHKHFLPWLEAMAWMGELSKAIVAIIALENIAAVSTKGGFSLDHARLTK